MTERPDKAGPFGDVKDALADVPHPITVEVLDAARALREAISGKGAVKQSVRGASNIELNSLSCLSTASFRCGCSQKREHLPWHRATDARHLGPRWHIELASRPTNPYYDSQLSIQLPPDNLACHLQTRENT